MGRLSRDADIKVKAGERKVHCCHSQHNHRIMGPSEKSKNTRFYDSPKKKQNFFFASKCTINSHDM